MPCCPACHAARGALEEACPQCGHSEAPVSVPDLALRPQTTVARKVAPPSAKKEELAIELAEDPRVFASASTPPPVQSISALPHVSPLSDDDMEASVLADFGPAPRSAWLSPLYAYRVIKRRSELRCALDGRREDAESARVAAEDALLAFAERARSSVMSNPAFASALAAIVAAEQTLKSRDQTLAADQAAHNERLRAIDARISKLESECAALRDNENAAQDQITQLETAIERAQAKIKRAEIELRNPKEPS